jgi:hypothetical protein
MHKDYIHSLLLPKRDIPTLASPQIAERKLSPWKDLTVAMLRLSAQDLHVEFSATSALNVYTHGSHKAENQDLHLGFTAHRRNQCQPQMLTQHQTKKQTKKKKAAPPNSTEILDSIKTLYKKLTISWESRVF